MSRPRRYAVILALLAAIPLHAADTLPNALEACSRIVSSSGRLACFDRVASSTSALSATRAGVGPVSDNLLAIAANERGRPYDDMRFRMSLPGGDIAEGGHVVITAPALSSERPKPLMAIACVDRITRLQLVVYPPVAVAQSQVSLSLDGHPLATDQAWQVLEGGNVVDAGRGLAAIDLLRRMKGGSELRVHSDLAAIDGLRFDTVGLTDLIAVQRKACRW